MSSKLMSVAARDYVTFHVKDLLLGLDISKIQEIHRDLVLTPVPHVPPMVRGVLNLRGEVVTILDLKMVLRGEITETGAGSKSVIVRSGEERAALLVDAIGDVIRCSQQEIEPVPSNVSIHDRRFFVGVKQMPRGLMIELDLDEVVAEIVRAGEDHGNRREL